MRDELQAREELDKEIVTTDGSWTEPEESEFRDNQIKTLLEKTIPSYCQMVTVFREKIWLAEPATRPYFAKLAKFVDIRERRLKGAISGEVYIKLRSTDDLDLFYDHLEKTHGCLRQSLVERRITCRGLLAFPQNTLRYIRQVYRKLVAR
jgi:hypothetical protein